MGIQVNYVPTPTGDSTVDKNNQDIQRALNAIIIALQELQTKAGIK